MKTKHVNIELAAAQLRACENQMDQMLARCQHDQVSHIGKVNHLELHELVVNSVLTLSSPVPNVALYRGRIASLYAQGVDPVHGSASVRAALNVREAIGAARHALERHAGRDGAGTPAHA